MNSKNKKSTIQKLVDHLSTYRETFGKSRLKKFNTQKIKLEKQLWLEKIQSEKNAKPEINSSLSKNEKNTLKQIIEEVQVELLTDGLKDLNDSVESIKRSLNTIQNEQIVSRGTNEFILPSEEKIEVDSEASIFRVNIKEEIDPSGAVDLPVDLKTAKEELNSWMQQKKILNYGCDIDQKALEHSETNIDYWNEYIQRIESNKNQETLLEALNLPDQKKIDSKLSLEELFSSLQKLERMYSFEQGLKDPDPEDSKYLEHRIKEVQDQIDLFNQEQFKINKSGAVDRKKEISKRWDQLINKLDAEEINLSTYRYEKAKLAKELNSILDKQENENISSKRTRQLNEFPASESQSIDLNKQGQQFKRNESGAVGNKSEQSEKGEGGQDTNEKSEPEKLVFLGRVGAVDNEKNTLEANLKKGAKLERKTNRSVWFIEAVFKDLDSKELLFQLGSYNCKVWYNLKDLEESFDLVGV